MCIQNVVIKKKDVRKKQQYIVLLILSYIVHKYKATAMKYAVADESFLLIELIAYAYSNRNCGKLHCK